MESCIAVSDPHSVFAVVGVHTVTVPLAESVVAASDVDTTTETGSKIKS